MTAIVTSKFRVLNAENFKEDISSAGTEVFVGIGKTDAWSLTTSDTTDTTPFVPYDTLDSITEARENLFGMKRLAASDISHVVPRHTWTTNSTYVAWDSNDADIFDKAFYIITKDFKVYKCIIAGTSGSTQEPVQTLTDPQPESDGYVWKYMFTISVADAEKFLTTSYMPVKTVSLAYADDAAAETALSEGDYAQYLNQKASRDSVTAAGIEKIHVTNPGTGYTQAPVVSITGSGTGATATATVSGGSVTAITVTAKGTNYSISDIVISGGGGSAADATVRAALSPVNGHGIDPVKDLGAFFIAINTLLTGNEGADLTVGNDFRQITLVKNPFNFGTTTVSTSTTLNATPALKFTTAPTFVVDELITQGSNPDSPQAYVTFINAGTGDVYFNQNSKTGYGPFVESVAVVGATSAASHVTKTTAAGFLLNEEVDKHSGDIIFLENRNPINRTVTQIEDIKIIIEF